MDAWLVVVLILVVVVAVAALIGVLMRRGKRGRLLIAQPGSRPTGDQGDPQ